MHWLSVALVAIFAMMPTLAWGQAPGMPLPFPGFQGTPEEQAACRPDVDRFCREARPDTFRVLACLQSQRPRISIACRRVLESHGQ